MSYLRAWNRHNSWAVRRCHFCKGKQGNNWLQKLSEDPPDTLPPPLLLRYELLNSRWGWLFDLLKIYQVSLPSCPWPSKLRGVAVSSLGGFEGARSWQTTFCGFANWRRWQAVSRENAISFVVNYQPTQSDTSQRKSSCSDSSFSCRTQQAKKRAHSDTYHAFTHKCQ